MAFLRPHGDQSARREPIVNLPPATQALLLVMLGVHLVRQLLSPGQDDWVVGSFAFIPARYTLPGGFGWEAVVSPVTYMLLHANWMHLIINGTALLAFGSGVERRLGAWRMLGFALVCGLASAALHYAFYRVSMSPVVGASGAISGLFGGVLRVLPGRRPGQGLRGLWPVIVVWIGGNVAFGLTGMPGSDADIAWVAHLGGFFAGLALFGLFDRRRPPA